MMGYNCNTTDHMKKRVLVWKKVQQMLAWGFLCMLMTACSVVRGRFGHKCTGVVRQSLQEPDHGQDGYDQS